MSLRRFILPIMLLILSGPLFAADLKTSYSDQQLLDILQKEGYNNVSLVKERFILVKIDGSNYVVINQKDGDIQFYYGISDSPVSYQTINEWNRTKRLSRAYIDNENDPVIEADLMANAGISAEHIAISFKVFQLSARQFAQFVSENRE